MLLSIAAAVFVLALLIVVHETGHFLAAKRAGVRVLRFSVGYPPKLLGVRIGQTEYALSATPFGGYVRMLGDEIGDELSASDVRTYLSEVLKDVLSRAGKLKPYHFTLATNGTHKTENPVVLEQVRNILASSPSLTPEEELLLKEILNQNSVEAAINVLSESPPAVILAALKQQAFPTQPLSRRVLIVLAGPLANILFVPVILTVVFMYGVPILLPIIGQVKPGLPAAQAGLEAGDKILTVNGHKVESWEELSRAVRSSQGEPLMIEYERTVRGVAVKNLVTVRPVREKGEGSGAKNGSVWMIGVLPRGDSMLKRFGLGSALIQAVSESFKMTVTLCEGLARIFTGAAPLRETLGGPIMIARLAGEQAHQGLANLGLFMAMLSLELGIINLFPVPMLDGGHLLFFLIEGLRGRPLQVRHREIAQQVGLVLLMALMAFVIFNDIARIAQG